MTLEWGVRCNFAEPASPCRTGAAAWVVRTNDGWCGERILVKARSRSGAWIRTWIATKKLTNFRAAWLHEKLRGDCAAWLTRQEADAWAVAVSKAWAA